MVNQPRFEQKLRLDRRYHWAHHRCGWSWAEEGLAQNLAVDSAATRFIGAVEHELGETGKPITGPWVGVSHLVENVPAELQCIYGRPISLHGHSDLLRASLVDCHGLFVLSDYMRTRLNVLIGNAVQVERLDCPTPLDVRRFSWECFVKNSRPQIIQLGHWCRRFHAIYDLPTDRFEKVWLPGRKIDVCMALRAEGRVQHPDARVATPGRVPNAEFDTLLTQNLALISLYDASANNSLLECIARATPVLVNPLPAVKEYLGDDYPLYFDSLDEAAGKAEDLAVLRQAHEYLVDWPKHRFSRFRFVETIANSQIYDALPR